MRQTRTTTRRVLLADAGRLALAASGLLPAAWPGAAAAQAGPWPDRPIRIVVPFTAGSFTDVVGRIVGDNLAKALGQPVIVDNKPGANGVLGVSEVTRAAPDGYTLLVTNSSSITINPQLNKSISYKASDLAPVTMLVEAPFILVVNPEWAKTNKVDSVKDLLEFARANPQQLTYGSAGPGNIAHLGYMLLSNKAGIKTIHIPYKGASVAQMAVLSGEIISAFDTWAAIPQIRAGKLKALAVSSDQRLPQLPDVPTLAQAGIPDVKVSFWAGLFAPAGTPEQIIQKLSKAAQGILAHPQAKAALSAQGEPAMLGPVDFGQRIRSEVSEWGSLIRREKISLD